MRYRALATDYDGTLAHHGHVDPSVLEAILRLRRTGRRLLLVTGRELGELIGAFPAIDAFDLVVAENGAIVYAPETRRLRLLAEPPPLAFVDALRARDVPISVGHVIVATWQPYEGAVRDVLRATQVDRQLIFNKGAVMILPSSVNKASGLAAALAELGLAPSEVVAIGDAENDHSLLEACGYGVAVANAVDALKERADWVTQGAAGVGVAELAALLETREPVRHPRDENESPRSSRRAVAEAASDETVAESSP